MVRESDDQLAVQEPGLSVGQTLSSSSRISRGEETVLQNASPVDAPSSS